MKEMLFRRQKDLNFFLSEMAVAEELAMKYGPCVEIGEIVDELLNIQMCHGKRCGTCENQVPCDVPEVAWFDGRLSERFPVAMSSFRMWMKQ